MNYLPITSDPQLFRIRRPKIMFRWPLKKLQCFVTTRLYTYNNSLHIYSYLNYLKLIELALLPTSLAMLLFVQRFLCSFPILYVH
jgi:hypothetical protein